MRQENIPWELIISNFKQEISEKDSERLKRWADRPECRAVMGELEAGWKKVQDNVSDYTPDKEYYWKILSERIGKAEQQLEKKAPEKTITLRKLYRYVAAACVVLGLSVGASYYWGTHADWKLGVEQVYTCIDGKSKVFLPNGTGVWLQSNTTLTYGNDFRKESRLVHLSGEAYFEVAKDKEKPFIVQIEGMQVVVHGTKFNVESPKGAAQSKVSLIEGSVSLITSSERVFLKPREIAVYDKRQNKMEINTGDVAFEKLWVSDELFISNKSLGEVCRLLSKRYGVKINVDDDLKDKYKYTFTIHNEALEEIIRIMARINPITYSFDEDNVLTITKKK